MESSGGKRVASTKIQLDVERNYLFSPLLIQN